MRVSAYIYRWFPFGQIKSFDQLESYGIARVLDLETGAADIFHETVYEQQKKKGGCYVMSWPLSNIFPMTRSEARNILVILESVRKLKLNTLVRCYSHVDRTGEVCILVRMKFEGWSFDRAYEEFVSHGRHWWFFWWKPFLRRACT